MTTLLTRTAAVAAAAGLTAAGIVQLGHHIPDHHWGTRGTVLGIVFTVGLLGAAIALEEVQRALGLARLGFAGARVAQVGLLAMTVQNVASTVHGGDVVSGLFFVGLLAALVGLLLVAVDGARRDTTLRWLAPLPLVGLVIGIAAGSHGGLVVWGVTWLAWLARQARRTPSAA